MRRPPDFSTFLDLEIKSAEIERRAFKGIATTRQADMLGDIVEPAGALFKLPLPLLHQHRQDRPIGDVTHARVTDKGIEIEAVGRENTRVHWLEEAWELIRLKLVKGLSIGFKPLEAEEILDKKGKWQGGLRFKRWSWLELSAVTIPANPGASLELRELARGDLTAAHDRELRRALLEGRYTAGDSPRDPHAVIARATAARIRATRERIRQ